ncbi:hypothetical protein CLU79DRAFT_738994 [Phycomyces nitens]|nr:hypothetical protein CLU79DRAFT_738994 [Phycomyces nitens]
MGKGSFFGRLKLGKKAHSSKSTANTPQSLGSVSSNSSASSIPQTPTETDNEGRGIFRTLEAVWYFRTSLIIDSPYKNEWTPFDTQSQDMLTTAALTKTTCLLPSNASLGSCSVSFAKTPSGSRRASASIASLHSKPLSSDTTARILQVDIDVRKIVSPVWWYEDNAYDGTKEMARFDYKNQVRLEALSDDKDSLVLTDAAFPQSFTVVLGSSKSRQSNEEWRGFMHLHPAPPIEYIYGNEMFREDMEGYNDYKHFTAFEQPFEFDVPLQRHFSV